MNLQEDRKRLAADRVVFKERCLEDAQALIDDGWYQVSRKFHIVARLPDGMTGIQALIRDSDHYDAEDWATKLGERSAGDYWLRCHAREAGCWITLSKDLFEAFRVLGGNTYR